MLQRTQRNNDESLEYGDSGELLNPYLWVLEGLSDWFHHGLSEFELIKRLQQEHGLIPDDYQGSTQALFTTHFLLFNALYVLQDRWLAQQKGLLRVSPLSIVFDRFQDSITHEPIGPAYLAESTDLELKAYYLDLRHLAAEDEVSLNRMLDGFWARLYRQAPAVDDHIQRALLIFGLSAHPQEEIDYKLIKSRYRKLAMAYHPDRGGDLDRIKDVNEAMAILSRYYRICSP
jgi:hypothetical protein